MDILDRAEGEEMLKTLMGELMCKGERVTVWK